MKRYSIYFLLVIPAVICGRVAVAQLDCTGVRQHEGDGMTLEFITAEVTAATDVGAPPGDTTRLFAAELDGRILAIDLSDNTVASVPFLDIQGSDVGRWEGGIFINDRCDGIGNGQCLLGFAFHPDYAQNGHFYVNYTRGSDRATLISRFTAVPPSAAVVDPASELVILELAPPGVIHNGGQLAFGPFDGYLYIAMGDGSPQDVQTPPGSSIRRGDDWNRSQDPTSLRGKMLRIDVDNATGGRNYGIPPDNPWVAPDDGVRDEIWSIGLRNPWRFAFDPDNGDLYIGDVGGEGDPNQSWEELNYRAADPATGITAGGENYQWRILEGTKVNYPSELESFGPGEQVGPLYMYPRVAASGFDGSSITGGVVYRGCRMPALGGTYFFGDWTRDWVATVRVEDGALSESPRDRTAELNAALGVGVMQALAFGTDARGEVYVSAWGSGGVLYRIVPTGDVLALSLPGDCNEDATLDLSDALCTLGVLFTGSPAVFPCGDGTLTDPGNIALIDWQPDGSVDLSDVLGILQFFFFGAGAHPLAVPGAETTECVAIPGCASQPGCP